MVKIKDENLVRGVGGGLGGLGEVGGAEVRRSKARAGA